MAKFQMQVTLNQLADYTTARVADGTGDANQLREADVGKLVKLKGDSRYGLCAAGDEIEGILETADEMQKQDGFSIGSVRKNGRIKVVFDGLQATPGTGSIAVGDFVVAGTPVALGTALSANPKVCKATAANEAVVFQWRVISILSGSGGVGSVGVIERV